MTLKTIILSTVFTATAAFANAPAAPADAAHNHHHAKKHHHHKGEKHHHHKHDAKEMKKEHHHTEAKKHPAAAIVPQIEPAGQVAKNGSVLKVDPASQAGK